MKHETKTHPKEYEVRTFEDLCNVVNIDNVNNLSEDIKNWLQHYAGTISVIRELHPKETFGKSNWELMEAGFLWIDDGENKLLPPIIEIKHEKSNNHDQD